MSISQKNLIKHKQGSIGELMVIALPMVISNACEVVMTFTDRLFLSKLGPEQMNAALGGGLSCFVMMTFFIGLTGFSTALVAQYLGSGRLDKCTAVTTQAMFINLAAYPLIILLRPIGAWTFSASGVPEEQLGPQITYFNILIFAVVIGLVRNALSCFFSGIGKTRVVMFSAIGAMFVNIFMNYILIFGKFGLPAMGIRGAAYGTICGGVFGLLFLFMAYFSKSNRSKYNVTRSFVFDLEIMKKLLRFGYPAGLEFFLNFLAFNAIILTFHTKGSVTATAVTILFNWDMVVFVPLIGIQIGVTSLVGRYMGASSPDTAHKVTMSGIKLGSIYSGLMFILFLGFPTQLVEIFRPSGEDAVFNQAQPVALFLIKTVVWYVMTDAFIVVFSGSLRGAGDTFWPMCISVILHWILVPLLYVMLHKFNSSAQAAWITLISVFMLFSVLFYLRYRSGKWRTIKVIHHEADEKLEPHNDFHETADL